MREAVEIEARKPLTKRQRALFFLDQDGICGCGCGVKMDHEREGTIDEHVLPLWCGGTNDLTNRKLYRKPCAAEKTSRETTARGKVNRIIAREDGTRRERKQIPSRPFDKGPKRKWPSRKMERKK